MFIFERFKTIVDIIVKLAGWFSGSWYPPGVVFSHLERYKRQDSGVTTTDHLVLLLLQDVEVEADVVPGVGWLGVRVDVRVRGEDTERADPRYLSLVRRPARQRHRHSLRPGRGRGH